MSSQPLAKIIGSRQTKAIQEALKPHLLAAGVHAVEERIGKPHRFLANARHRGTLRVRDFFAVCAALDLDPGEFIRETLHGTLSAEIRRPRIIAVAWKRAKEGGGDGIGEEKLAALQSEMQERPRQARTVLARELKHASLEEIPRVLGLYGSGLRVLSDLDRAELIFKEALEIARTFDLPAAQPDLLLRVAYLELERERPDHALRWAEKSTLEHARLGNREGQGIGFETLGMLRYYTEEYQAALRDFDTALRFLRDPMQKLATHQIAALCYAGMGAEEQAWQRASKARRLAHHAPEWMRGKLSWLDARLTTGVTRLGHLQRARKILCPKRPLDCALVTVELIEESFSQGEDVERYVMGLCALLEKTGSQRIEQAIVRLARRGSRLTPRLVSEICKSLDRARDRRLSTLVTADLIS